MLPMYRALCVLFAAAFTRTDAFHANIASSFTAGTSSGASSQVNRSACLDEVRGLFGRSACCQLRNPRIPFPFFAGLF